MRAVVGDVRLPTGEVESSVLYYYFPYGFLREGGSYRYGYNGQERSDNINGLGNHTTAFYWEYSTHYARRWNTDPKPVAGLSPYSVFQGNPILFTDVLGDTVQRNKYDLLSFSGWKNIVTDAGEVIAEIANAVFMLDDFASPKALIVGGDGKALPGTDLFGAPFTEKSLFDKMISFGNGQFAPNKAEQAARKITFQKFGGQGKDILNKGVHFHFPTLNGAEMMLSLKENTIVFRELSSKHKGLVENATKLFNDALQDQPFKEKVIQTIDKTINHISSQPSTKDNKPTERLQELRSIRNIINQQQGEK